MKTMKAVRLEEIGKPLVIQNIPIPTPGPMDALVRIRAAGICYSDVHMWAGQHPVAFLPITLGHEVAGVVEAIGDQVDPKWVGQRVALHYIVGCGKCSYCRQGREQLCSDANFLGPTLDGGYAEFISIPVLNLVPLPQEISFEHGAVLMCSGATSYHTLRRGRLQAGESIAIFGTGGVGMSAVQLARAFGASKVFAVDIQDDKLLAAQHYGAIPVNASKVDPVSEIQRMTDGRGVDVAVGIIALASSMEQALQSVCASGRVVIVGMEAKAMKVRPMEDVVVKEVDILGSVDHVYYELPQVIEFVQRGALDLSGVVERTILLEAGAINDTFLSLSKFGGAIRTVITPG